MDLDFWRGKRVFITGHTGFKGSWLSLLLSGLGAKVTGYALSPSTSPNLFSAGWVESGIDSVIGDVRDFEQLSSSILGGQPSIVIHMAAQALVRQSYKDPLQTYATNIMGTANLLESVRTCPSVRAVIVVTSDKCYENREWVWGYRETESLGGYDPYSSSKACTELVTNAYRQSFFSSGSGSVALATARAGNVIGGGDWSEDRLLPDVARAVSTGEKVIIRNPGAIRPWQHALEPLLGYLQLSESLWNNPAKFSGAWNFGPADTDARPVEWVVEEACRLWGDKASWELDPSHQPHEAHYLKLDCSKARQVLGWQPKLSLAESLAWTIDWYRTYYRFPNDARRITEEQINRYLTLTT